MSTSLDRDLGLGGGPGAGRTLGDFLFPAPAPRSAGAILGWWERRRPAYNLIVGTSGVVAIGAVLVLTWLPPGGLLLGLPPWQPIVAFGLLANVFYTLGSVIEIAVDKLWGRQVLPVGPALFRMGLTFSVGLTMLPVMMMLVMWVLRIVGVV